MCSQKVTSIRFSEDAWRQMWQIQKSGEGEQHLYSAETDQSGQIVRLVRKCTVPMSCVTDGMTLREIREEAALELRCLRDDALRDLDFTFEGDQNYEADTQAMVLAILEPDLDNSEGGAG
jgi:hypothetical protein